MHHRAAAVAFAGLILVLGSCSSGGGSAAPTTTAPPETIIENLTTTVPSTLPPQQLAAALKVFFAAPGGKALLQFEKASAVLSTGRVLTRAECLPYQQVFGRIGSSDYLIAETQLIPDPYLSKKFHDDVAIKHLYMAVCTSGTPVPPQTGPNVKRYTNNLRAEMAKHGYTI